MTVTTIVPYQSLPTDLIQKVIESFITREGTDYGLVHYSLEEKVEHIRLQLKKKEAYIVFEGESESITLITAQQAKPLLDQEGHLWQDEDV
jgi:uncharacterized protein YheU (UPF0270 family)